MNVRLERVEKRVRVALATGLLGWCCFAALLLYLKFASPPRTLTVMDGLGNTAVITGTGISFYPPSSQEIPVAWFSSSPTPQLQMTLDGVPIVRIGALTNNGFLWLRSKDGRERLLLPLAESAQ